MKLLLVAIIALIVGFFGSVNQASAQTTQQIGCYGAPADYVARFDTVRFQSKNNQVDYSDGRTYFSFQTWLTPVGTEEGHDSEHWHVEGCFPHHMTWKQPNNARYLDLVVRAHNVKGYRVTNLSMSYNSCAPHRVPGVDCGQNNNSSVRAFRADLDDPAFLTDATNAANASGHTGATSVFRSFKLAPVTWDGPKEARLHLITEATCDTRLVGCEALVLKWVMDARWYSTDNYGLPDGSIWPDNPQRNLGLRTIVDHFKTDGVNITTGSYHHSRFVGSYKWQSGFFRNARTGSFAPQPLVTDGGGPAQYEVDPNHHVHPDFRGSYFEDFYLFSPSGPSTGPIVCPNAPVYVRNTCPQPIPLGGLTSGLHRLFFGSDDEPDCVRNDYKDGIPEDECVAGTRPKWRNVVVIPFRKL